MASVNKAIIVGNLGRDPEIRYTQNNTPVATFSIATTDQWSDRNGEKQERTEWHRIVAWGRLAEMEPREKNAISHRGRALRKLLDAARRVYGPPA